MWTTWVISGLSMAVGFALAWLIFSMQSRAARDQLRTDALANEARTDPLTGLRNRRSFHEELSRLFAQRQRQGIVFSMLMIDIDHFKQVNDAHGHPAGDHVLRSVAQLLTKTLREMDFVCRFGGDEFTVICAGSRLHEAAVAAERVRRALATNPVRLKNGEFALTLSVGVAEVGSSEIAEGLIQRADEALYAAKQAGRNRVHWHDGNQCVPAGSV